MMESYADKMAALRAVYQKKQENEDAKADEVKVLVADLWSVYTGAAINEEDVDVMMQLTRIAEKKCGRV